jgi:ribosomal protein L3 glutamine methyltransferase
LVERRSLLRAPLTVADVFHDTVRRLVLARLHYGHGTHNARDEAAYLVLHALRLPIDSLAPYAERRLSAVELRRLRALVDERIGRRVPASYLTHEAWLGDFSFYVDRRSIIPRSFIAELLRDGLQPWLRKPVRRILDLCTGSGCLAILAAHAFPKARVDATDVSQAALNVARRNVRRYHLSARLRLLKSDLYSALGDARYDLIVCNPPYVDARSMRKLPPEYRHEPALALAGGADGLDVVRRILNGAADYMSADAILVCEIGHNRKVLERSYPMLPFVWLETSSGPDHVFLIAARELAQLSATRSRARGGAATPRAPRPRTLSAALDAKRPRTRRIRDGRARKIARRASRARFHDPKRLK